MGKKEDLTGRHFGRLTVIEESEKLGQKVAWLCKCDCGRYKRVRSHHLKGGQIQSCGCYQREQTSTHRQSYSKLYRTWASMKDRCLNPTAQMSHYYKDRGITICDEWINSFEAFSEWAEANGYKEGLSLDRIDVNGNYEPSNCRWATPKMQARNTRHNHNVTFRGETRCVSEWAEITGINVSTIFNRLKYGWSVEETLTKPVQKRTYSRA